LEQQAEAGHHPTPLASLFHGKISMCPEALAD
jgi:hypothetical protein